MNEFDRAAALARRHEIAETYSEPFGSADSLRLVNEVAELLNQATRLDAALLVADTNLTRVEAEHRRVMVNEMRLIGALKMAEASLADVLRGIPVFDLDAVLGAVRTALVAVETDKDEEQP